MVNKIVQLRDNDENDVFPIAGGMAENSVTKQMLAEGVFEGQSLSTPSDVAYVATDNIQDGAVTSDKIDLSTSIKQVTATFYFRQGLQATGTIRVTKLGKGLFMATGAPVGYIVATATQNFIVRTASPLFKTIFGASGSARQEAQSGSYLKYFAAQISLNLIDSYINCPNTTSAAQLQLFFIVFGELTDEMEHELFG